MDTTKKTLMSFTVLGAHENRNFFEIKVDAPDGLHAFGAAALLMQEAGEEGDAEFYAAVSSDGAYELPGDGVVTLETVLDPEQSEVFGLAVFGKEAGIDQGSRGDLTFRAENPVKSYGLTRNFLLSGIISSEYVDCSRLATTPATGGPACLATTYVSLAPIPCQNRYLSGKSKSALG